MPRSARRVLAHAAAPYVPMGAAAEHRPFNPAEWLAEADALGYRCYAYPHHKGGYSMMFEYPQNGSASSDLWLWRWLRPNRDVMEANHTALRDHMLETGRFAAA